MAKEMLINVSAGEECRIAVVEDGKLEELYMERTSSATHVGNVYKGKVTNVEASIQAAFVDFGIGRNGFLHVSDLMPAYWGGGRGENIKESVGRKLGRRDRPPIQHCLRRGDEIIVQVIKEGLGTKGPTLSSYLSIPGRILVMMPGVGKSGVSKKIEDEDERRRLRDILDKLNPPKDAGFIIRTAGVGRSEQEIERDFRYLMRLWEEIAKADTKKAPLELYAEGDLVMRTVRDVYTSDIERIIVDDKDTAKRIKDFFKLLMPRTKNKVEVYDETVPLFHEYKVERDIEMMNSRTVPLPSGGSLVIDQTEAVVAIDVNSGKSRQSSDAETSAFRTDMEAADEIPRQLKLRDLGGVVICDFIDLRFERHRRELEARLDENLKKDRAKTRFLAMSEFGIVEMTRQRMRPSLKKSVYQDCPHCGGQGLVKSVESMGLDVVRKLAIAAHDDRVKRANLSLHPDIAVEVLNRKRTAIAELEEHTGKRLVVQIDNDLAQDEMLFELFDEREGHVYLPELGMEAPQGGQGGRPGHDRGRRDGRRGGRNENRQGGGRNDRDEDREEFEDRDVPSHRGEAHEEDEGDGREAPVERNQGRDQDRHQGRDQRGGRGGRDEPRRDEHRDQPRHDGRRPDNRPQRDEQRHEVRPLPPRPAPQPIEQNDEVEEIGEPDLEPINNEGDGGEREAGAPYDIGGGDGGEEGFDTGGQPNEGGAADAPAYGEQGYSLDGGGQQQGGGGRRRRRRRGRRGRGGSGGVGQFDQQREGGPPQGGFQQRPQGGPDRQGVYSNDPGVEVFSDDGTSEHSGDRQPAPRDNGPRDDRNFRDNRGGQGGHRDNRHDNRGGGQHRDNRQGGGQHRDNRGGFGGQRHDNRGGGQFRGPDNRGGRQPSYDERQPMPPVPYKPPVVHHDDDPEVPGPGNSIHEPEPTRVKPAAGGGRGRGGRRGRGRGPTPAEKTLARIPVVTPDSLVARFLEEPVDAVETMDGDDVGNRVAPPAPAARAEPASRPSRVSAKVAEPVVEEAPAEAAADEAGEEEAKPKRRTRGGRGRAKGKAEKVEKADKPTARKAASKALPAVPKTGSTDAHAVDEGATDLSEFLKPATPADLDYLPEYEDDE
jgi:ribonuclease E